MIKLVVFDWNGTLLADVTAVVEGSNEELRVLNRPPIDVNQYRELYEIPIAAFYKKLGIDMEEYKAKSVQVAAAFHAFYEPRVARTRTRRGTRAALDELGQLGIKRIILSNHTNEGIYLQLERLKLSHHFESVLANENTTAAHFSGKQQRLQDYLAKSHIKPEQTLIIGDTIEEVHIGKNLGLHTVAITGGYNTTKRLQAVHPDAIIHSIHDLITVVKEL